MLDFDPRESIMAMLRGVIAQPTAARKSRIPMRSARTYWRSSMLHPRRAGVSERLGARVLAAVFRDRPPV